MRKKNVIATIVIIVSTLTIISSVLLFGGLLRINLWPPPPPKPNTNSSSANLIMLDWQELVNQSESQGRYASINFVIKNDGNGTATFGSVQLHSINQDGIVKADTIRFLPTGLQAGKTYTLTFTVDLEQEDTLLNNTIKITWNGGSNDYSKIITL